ncbi:MAG: hypothetical protein JW747_04660 [Candidatus Aminicenantes bacterium]|nr:hypothetical protein [Candidatus Aminicenantes bacterium]
MFKTAIARYDSTDLTDDALISAAVRVRTELFVTGDAKLLKLVLSIGTTVVSPKEFWERLARRKR